MLFMYINDNVNWKEKMHCVQKNELLFFILITNSNDTCT